MILSTRKKILELHGKTAVFIDWANVYGWQESLKKKIDTGKLFNYLKSYKEIKDIRFYFGSDDNEGSKKFLKSVELRGYSIISKPVKYILVAEIKGQKVYKRKCDFDVEICIDVHKFLKQDYETYIFFTGDGDFEPLYKLLIKENKQVVVVYMYGHLGKEIWAMKKGIFKASIVKLEADLFRSQKMTPGAFSRPRA